MNFILSYLINFWVHSIFLFVFRDNKTFVLNDEKKVNTFLTIPGQIVSQQEQEASPIGSYTLSTRATAAAIPATPQRASKKGGIWNE